MADKIKNAVAFLLLAAGIAAFYYWAESTVILRVGAVLGGAVAGFLVFGTTEPGRQFRAYAREAVVETRKVAWPSREETLKTTGAVFAFVVVMALILWLVDAGLVWLVRLLMGRTDV